MTALNPIPTATAVASSAGDLDRGSPIPLYFQLKQILEAELSDGRLAPGDRLPPEPELCARFDVSRTTIRQALAAMESKGTLRREKGRGTFVAEPRVSSGFLQSSLGFFDEARRAGQRVSSRVLRCEREPLTGWAAEVLRRSAGSPGVTLERLRAVDDAVVMYVVNHLVPEVAEAVEPVDLTDRSLYTLLRERCGVHVAGGRRTVEAVVAEPPMARLLDVAQGTPVLYVESVSWDAAERPFECYRAWHRSDRSRIEVRVVPDETPNESRSR